MALFKKQATPFQTNKKLLEERPWLWAVNSLWRGQEIYISHIEGERFLDHPVYLGMTHSIYFHRACEVQEEVDQIDLPRPYLENGREPALWDMVNAGSQQEYLAHIVLVQLADSGDDYRYIVFTPKRGESFYSMWRHSWRYEEHEANRQVSRRLKEAQRS